MYMSSALDIEGTLGLGAEISILKPAFRQLYGRFPKHSNSSVILFKIRKIMN